MIRKLRPRNEKGFTLIELMIVVGILAAIAIPNFLSYQKKGYDASAKAEAANFYSTCLAYVGDVGTATDRTLTSAAPPTGFSVNGDVVYDGTFVVDTAGATTSSMTFQHNKSSNTYSLDENGHISGN